MVNRRGALLLVVALVAASCAPATLAGQPEPSVMTGAPDAVFPGGLVVATSAQLEAALSQKSARDVTLSPGTYDSPHPFVNDAGHRLRAAIAGRVVLEAGLVIGGSSNARNALVEGIVFDIHEPPKTLDGSAIHVWGAAAGARIVDVTVFGHGLLGSAVMVRQPEGLFIKGVTAQGFTDYGIIVDSNDRARELRTPAVLEDLTISDVSRAQPRSSVGTAEACLWIGNTAVVLGAVLRSCAWTGLWTGTAAHGLFVSDVVIDQTPVGVYVEHFTTGSLFQRLRVGPHVQTGLACEWADPHWDHKPACVDDVVQDSTIDSCAVGVSLGEGTTRTTIRRIRFLNQQIAAALDPSGFDNRYVDNDFGGIVTGAREVWTREPVGPLIPICPQ